MFLLIMMKVRGLYLLFLMFIAGIMFFSCRKKPIYPSEPEIEYINFLKYGNPANPDSVELVVSFTDNEGDIGLEQSDTLPIGIFSPGNFWMIYFYWDTTGIDHWSAWDANPSTPAIDTLKVSYRVPPVLPDGDPSEPMKGLIAVKQAPFFKIHNKIYYKVYMYDKAKHKSNVIDTPPLTFP